MKRWNTFNINNRLWWTWMRQTSDISSPHRCCCHRSVKRYSWSTRSTTTKFLFFVASGKSNFRNVHCVFTMKIKDEKRKKIGFVTLSRKKLRTNGEKHRKRTKEKWKNMKNLISCFKWKCFSSLASVMSTKDKDEIQSGKYFFFVLPKQTRE